MGVGGILMQLHEIKQGIILCNANVHHEVRKELLKDKEYLFDIKLLDLHSLFLPKILESKTELLYLIYNQFSSIKEDLVYFKDRIHEYPFIIQIQSFLNDYYFYEMTLEDLPQERAYEKELVLLLQSLLALPHPYKDMKAIKHKLTTIDPTSIYIYPSFTTLEEQYLLDQLLERGATLLTQVTYPIHCTVNSYVNSSQEIEYLAQLLSKKEEIENIQVAVPNAEVQEQVKQFFTRYGLPYSVLHESSKDPLALHFKHLLEYYFSPNEQTIDKILQNNPYNIKYTNELLEIKRSFKFKLDDDFSHLSTIEFNNEYFHSYDQKVTLHKLEKALFAREQYIGILDQLHSLQSTKEVFQYINESLLDVYTTLTPQQEQCLRQLQVLLIESIDFIKEDTYPLFLSLFSTLQQTPPSTTGGILITTYFDSVIDQKEYYLVGTTQKNYPGFSVKKGIFDEDYYKSLPYPKMSTRFEHHLQQCQRNLESVPCVIASFPLSTFEGKTLEGAMELESIAKNIIHNKIVTNFPQRSTGSTSIKPILETAFAEQLYFKDKVIKGSVSSLELYNSCPLQYFLKYGLRVKEPLQTAFQTNTVGSLLHKLFEILVTTYQKDYPTVEDHILKELIDHEVSTIELVYPFLKEEFVVVKKRLFLLLKESLSFLKEVEQDSNLYKYQTEVPFQNEYPLSNGYIIDFKGIVDRVQLTNDRFIIIDYKSSAHSFKLDDFLAGRKLQLVTYSTLLEEVLEKKCIGSYYYNFKPKKISIDAYEVKRRSKEVRSFKEPEVLLNQITKENQYIGLSFLDEASMISKSGIALRNLDKDGDFKVIYNIKKLKEVQDEIYTKTVSTIASGVITPNVSDKCTYCAYQSVCRMNTKDKPKAKPMVEVNKEELYLKGGKK